MHGRIILKYEVIFISLNRERLMNRMMELGQPYEWEFLGVAEKLWPKKERRHGGSYICYGCGAKQTYN
jgi:hypothetical protein